ncbi:hypothetical protein [Desulfosediminicola flagellatus]|uniref:hypothetical protein n=1 Tax=Desulfosediminicola flagellatus TaxID=2569541 RepID=UPI0010AC0201|nr:hypothetical protein [Desulfosediminicola flagellatus]
MKWLVILDPIEGLLEETDTSLAIIRQARLQGIEVDTTTIDLLYFSGQARVVATAEDQKEYRRGLDEYDLIFMRKEPPYDLAFHYATQLLSLTNTPVVNSPESLRNFNEKLIALPFSAHMPPTLVSSSPQLISEFIDTHGSCVIKSLDSFQGKSVLRIEPGQDEPIEEFTFGGRSPVMVQKFLTLVYEGDKRVIMLGDKVLGAAMRKPRSGYHANFASSDALKTHLTPREQAIVDEVGPWMVSQGIHFSGLDFIGENLTEINITCPTGIIQISRLDKTDLPRQIVDYFLKIAS